MEDHVHILISIPPKYAMSQVVGYIKGKSAINIAMTYAGRYLNFIGQSFLAKGYLVSTSGGSWFYDCFERFTIQASGFA